MSVWYAIPSKRNDGGTLPLWRARGYKTAVWRDTADGTIDADLVLIGEYPGYAKAVNALSAEILERYPETQWIVTGGDDIEPDGNNTPEMIAEECSQYFGGTFGVMQPTGDRWGADPKQPNHIGSAYADRVCGSPWMGAEWCRRAHGGLGPLWPEFRHMFVDEALQYAAVQLNLLWQRPDLVQFHRHWARGQGAKCPGFLAEANSPQHWREASALLTSLKNSGNEWLLPLESR